MFGQIDASRKEQIRKGMDELSDRSRYLRFMHPVRRLTDKELEYFSNVDQHYHVAWGGLEIKPDGTEHGIAVGRYVTLDAKPDTAEFALTVLDDLQSKGVGKYLLAILYIIARRNGLKYLTGMVMPHNTHATERLRMLKADTKSEDGVIEVNLPLLSNNEFPDNDFANKVKQAIVEIEPLMFND